MAICYKCGTRQASKGPICSTCLSADKTQSQSRQSLARSARFHINKKAFVWGGVVLFAIFVMFESSILGYGTFPKLNLQSATGSTVDPCDEVERCLVVFMTPWCPACKSSIPFVKELQAVAEERPDFGIAVYIGGDQNSRLQGMALQFHPPAFIDANSFAQGVIGIRSVPSWARLNAERTIVNRGSGLYGGLTRSHPAFPAAFEEYTGLPYKRR